MIKIIAGVYGYKENGIILPKDKDSEPFSLDPEREAELVRASSRIHFMHAGGECHLFGNVRIIQ